MNDLTETTRTIFGLDAIAAMFDRAKAQNRIAFLPFAMIGYPDYEQSLDAIEGMAKLDVDAFEIGIPFSDSLADGPVNQVAAQKSLENGITVAKTLEAVRELRERGVTQPMLTFSNLNPLLAYGVEKLVLDAKAAGADGFIIPDLPPEEAGMFVACEREHMALVFLVAPTSNPQRIKLIGERASGFIYVVSVTGTTGARTELPPDLIEFIHRIRAQIRLPLVLGFGISTPEHVRALNGLMDGFIVGSALMRTIGSAGLRAMLDLAARLRQAVDQ